MNLQEFCSKRLPAGSGAVQGRLETKELALPPPAVLRAGRTGAHASAPSRPPCPWLSFSGCALGGLGARAAGSIRSTNGTPDPVTPARATSAFSLHRRRRALVLRSWKPLLRVFLFLREVCLPWTPRIQGRWCGAPRVAALLLSTCPVPCASLLTTVTATQLVVNKCQLTR